MLNIKKEDYHRPIRRPIGRPIGFDGMLRRRYTGSVILDIIKYGHPVLREKGQRIERVTPEIRKLAADMIDTMRGADGVGLAAQQVGRAILLTVIDVTESELPSELLVNGEPQDLAGRMPLVLLNPQLRNPQGEQVGPEGCLSVPDISAEIRRAAQVTVRARTLDGADVEFTCTGLLARAAQHEMDHLNGVLFIDRMDAVTRAGVAEQLKLIQQETQAQLGRVSPRRRVAAVR